mmetsp:Transcript_1642/g.2420  ORF Transcript_1642/g.2420 Transcript_1642/m.2420 type:complete len:225 (+) Transcript_1642:3-677(+)
MVLPPQSLNLKELLFLPLPQNQRRQHQHHLLLFPSWPPHLLLLPRLLPLLQLKQHHLHLHPPNLHGDPPPAPKLPHPTPPQHLLPPQHHLHLKSYLSQHQHQQPLAQLRKNPVLKDVPVPKSLVPLPPLLPLHLPHLHLHQSPFLHPNTLPPSLNQNHQHLHHVKQQKMPYEELKNLCMSKSGHKFLLLPCPIIREVSYQKFRLVLRMIRMQLPRLLLRRRNGL